MYKVTFQHAGNSFQFRCTIIFFNNFLIKLDSKDVREAISYH